ncbi:MAG: phosphoribose diphosphate:decaprenyl-phosphate phosphoribosyltransferase [Microgenomates group bacterium GW2011_GWA2_46_7]|nr:MAG: phosphoribose diphosphate:decaprenyl-phosphate phosphoribosyltransferase [Microgenomates group bacterium GW2011_GWA2_46_7]
MDQLVLVLKSIRVTQWIKNVVVFAPIIFSGFLFVPGYFTRVVWAFILFCLLSSAIYLFNDIIDIPSDRLHPFKKRRPIASGALPLELAVFLFILLSAISLWLGFATSTFFFATMGAYFIINILYTLWWKRISILDVFVIAAGFVIRVYAGSFVINVHMDVWFLLTVISASLFLAVGKRRSEMTLLSGSKIEAKETRPTLMHYTPGLLDAYTSMFANTTWLTYALFSFLHPPFTAEGRVLKLFSLLPRTLLVDKWLMGTVPIVIFGVMRYMLLIYEKNEGESPHKVIMTDKPLLLTVMIWGVMVIAILYFN